MVLGPVVERYRARNIRRYFRGDAAFAKPEIYEFLEAEGYIYAIRLPTNPILQKSIAHLLTRPVGRPPNWHPGKLCPRVGFIVTNLRPTGQVCAAKAGVRLSTRIGLWVGFSTAKSA